MQPQEEAIMIRRKRSNKRPRAADLNPTSDRITPSSSTNSDNEEEDMANCLILLARGWSPDTYRCKTCDRSFPSFQALGGHRASHRRITGEDNKKAMVGEKQEDIRNETNYGRVHECSICGAEFGSGQALGGHMRRHRPIARPRNMLSLDLNRIPAPEDEGPGMFPFAAKEQVGAAGIFTASLVDCHY